MNCECSALQNVIKFFSIDLDLSYLRIDFLPTFKAFQRLLLLVIFAHLDFYTNVLSINLISVRYVNNLILL